MMFHDGGIEGWNGDENKLTLTIGCTYLAEKINPDFDFFYLELIGIEKLELECWGAPGSPDIILTSYKDIFENDLEIDSGDVKNGDAIVYFHQQWGDSDFNGGMMVIRASGVKVFQQDMKELTYKGLSEVVSDYWKSFGNRNK